VILIFIVILILLVIVILIRLAISIPTVSTRSSHMPLCEECPEAGRAPKCVRLRVELGRQLADKLANRKPTRLLRNHEIVPATTHFFRYPHEFG
jgi:hypothetical protein